MSNFGCRSSARLILEIDIGKLLTGVVAHDKARGLFFDGPRRRGSGGRSLLLPHGTTNDQDQEAGCGKNNQE
jgi:hypothetical protein